MLLPQLDDFIDQKVLRFALLFKYEPDYIIIEIIVEIWCQKIATSNILLYEVIVQWRCCWLGIAVWGNLTYWLDLLYLDNKIGKQIHSKHAEYYWSWFCKFVNNIES